MRTLLRDIVLFSCLVAFVAGLRDRGCDLAHLILRFCRTNSSPGRRCVVDLIRLFSLGDAQAARLLIIRCPFDPAAEKTPSLLLALAEEMASITPQDALQTKLMRAVVSKISHICQATVSVCTTCG